MQTMKNKITWIQPYYDLVLNLIPLDAKKILDVGSGNGIFGFILKKTRDIQLTGIEPFEQYALSHYDHIINKKWQDCSYNMTSQYDVITALEIIEHLERKDVLPFLKLCKSLAKKVIITTPYKFEQQPTYDNNPLQKHLSLITSNDFVNEGYKVYLFGTMNLKLITIRFMAHRRFEFLFNKIKIVKITNLIGVYND